MHHLARLGAAAIVGAIVLAAIASTLIWAQGARDERRPADAIVVLGAAQYNGRPSRIFEARLEHAVDLWQAGLAPYLVVTGGKAHGDLTTEAETGRIYARGRGVPPEAILAESAGRTTLESLAGVAALMRERGLASAIFVSDRTHTLRVLRIATDEGIQAWGSPTTSSPLETNLAWQLEATAHELGALGVYFLGAGGIVGDPADPGPAAPEG